MKLNKFLPILTITSVATIATSMASCGNKQPDLPEVTYDLEMDSVVDLEVTAKRYDFATFKCSQNIAKSSELQTRVNLSIDFANWEEFQEGDPVPFPFPPDTCDWDISLPENIMKDIYPCYQLKVITFDLTHSDGTTERLRSGDDFYISGAGNIMITHNILETDKIDVDLLVDEPIKKDTHFYCTHW